MKLAALLFDLGDTIMVEETEVKDAEETTLRAELAPGMAKALREFRAAGHRLALIADSRPQTPANVLRQHGLVELFETLAVSEIVGAAKPDPRLFRAALDALGIPQTDYGQVVMVGNNLERDIVGANRLGLISVFYHLNDRRRTQPLTADEVPRYTVASAAELRDLIEKLATGAGAPVANFGGSQMSFTTRQAKGLTKCLADISLDPEKLRFHISEIAPGTRAHPPHTHAAIEAFYVLEGHGAVEVGAERHEIGPNEALILDATVEHGLVNIGDTPMRYMVIIAKA